MRPVIIACFVACLASPSFAQAPPAQDDVITVWGKRQREIGHAYSASEGVVDFGKFVDRPLLRVGELAEVVPGLAATQHSGTGKANQYFLRGFNLDHGTDFSISLDGIPLNLRTNAHGQGYLDINLVIPEVIERIQYRKGVAAADVGDFSAAGSAAFSTFAHLPENFAQLEVGENNWRRAVAGMNLGDSGYAALDVTTDDGPWTKPEDLKKLNGFLRLGAGPWGVSAGAYHAEWNATDQIPERAVHDGRLNRLSDVDPNVGGSTDRAWLNAAYADASGLRANAYVMRYRLKLTSNFTHFLEDPINGDAFQQAESRTIVGGSISKTFDRAGAWTPSLGAETRIDRIDPIGLYKVTGRNRRETVRQDKVDQASAAVWGALDGDFGRARLNLGLRADAMRVDVTASDPRNSGAADDVFVSPKASLAWRFAQGVEGYVSAGQGFHSNDARGATIAFDPASGDPVSRAPLLVRANGVETGLRVERGAFQATASVFGLDLESELVFVGDEGATEALGASRRYGGEITATWAPMRFLTLDAAAAATHARFRDAPKGEDRIPLSVDYVLTGGATVRIGDTWTGSLTLRRIGPAPLIEDNSARSDASTVVNGRLARRMGRVTLAAEALNLFDSEDADITYFYASRLPGEPADGVEDIHFHPVPPRSFRLQARVTF